MIRSSHFQKAISTKQILNKMFKYLKVKAAKKLKLQKVKWATFTIMFRISHRLKKMWNGVDFEKR